MLVGRNLPYYDFRAVRSLTAVDRSAGMLRETTDKWDDISRALQHSQGDELQSGATQPKLAVLQFDLNQLSVTPSPSAAPPSVSPAGARSAGTSRAALHPSSSPSSPPSPSPSPGSLSSPSSSTPPSTLPFAAGSFDCVVDTFGLCSYGDETAALREMGRLVRPHTGRVLLLQHGRRHTHTAEEEEEERQERQQQQQPSMWGAVGAAVSGWLDGAVNGYLARHRARHLSSWGCVWDKDLEGAVERMVVEHGWRIVDKQHFHARTGLLIVAAVDGSEHSAKQHEDY